MLIIKKGFLVIVFLVLTILIYVKTNNEPIILNENYINSDILLDTDYVDKILFMDENEKYVICLCSVYEEELMLLILENNEYYDLHYRYSFSIDSLTEDPYKIMTDAIWGEDSQVWFNVFLNPKDDTVKIDESEQDVNIINFSTSNHEIKLGLWWFV